MEALFHRGLQIFRSAAQPGLRLLNGTPLLSSSRVLSNSDAVVQKQCTSKVIAMVNNLIENKQEGRLFAVVQVCGKQFKVTNNDIIVVEGYWPPTVGDEVRLEKVLLTGAADFTLIGRPLLPLNQVSVKATIIEKTLTHTKTTFRYMKRKQYKNINFLRNPLTYIRINSIDLLGKVDSLGDVDGDKDRVF